MKKINMIFFSANRAEYGLIFPFFKVFSEDKRFKTNLIVGGSHMQKKFGLSINEIKKDKINYTQINLPLKTNTLDNASDYFNKIQKKINLFLKKRNTDIVFLSSDRFETFAFAVSSYLKKIPIIHYEGGDITEGGALDDNIRHAITKISNLHLTTNKQSLKRILNMGEEKWRCFNIGYSPFYLMQRQKFDKKKIEKKFSINPKKPLILFTFHPVVKKENDQRKDVDEVFKTLEYLSKNNQIIITYPNFDPMGVRPEHITLSRESEGIPASVLASEYLGTTQIVSVQVDRSVLKARVSATDDYMIGSPINLVFDARNISLFDNSSGKALRSDANQEVLAGG